MIVASWEGSDLVVRCDGDIQVDVIEVVLDLDRDGQVLGIEILELIGKYPKLGWHEIDTGGTEVPSISFDLDAGAIYIRLKSGRSVDQLVRQAVLGFDDHGRIHQVRVLFEP